LIKQGNEQEQNDKNRSHVLSHDYDLPLAAAGMASAENGVIGSG
jgi:hypothetical protein